MVSWFLDGDGHVDKNLVHFTSNIWQDWTFLENLCKEFGILYHINRWSEINKKTKKLNSRSRLSINVSQGNKKFFDFVYQNIENNEIGLNRKYLGFKRMYPEGKIKNKFKPTSKITPLCDVPQILNNASILLENWLKS